MTAAAPPDNWLPPAAQGCGLVSPGRRVRGCGWRAAGGRTCATEALRLSLKATGCARLSIPGERLLEQPSEGSHHLEL